MREHIPMTSKWVTNDARVVIKKSVTERRNDFPSLSPGDQPLTKEYEDSGYEIVSGGWMGIHPLDKVIQSAVQSNGPS